MGSQVGALYASRGAVEPLFAVSSVGKAPLFWRPPAQRVIALPCRRTPSRHATAHRVSLQDRISVLETLRGELWRRLTEWHEAGVWEGLHKVLLERLAEADQIDWSRASVDSASVAAPRGQR
jgi:hypothetical protein